jgi:tetratricopeptide (TPR) repeat protein
LNEIAAFVGHSFREEDEPFVKKILAFLNTIGNSVAGFSWDHALGAQPRQVSQKVLEKIEGKNLFIGICSANEYVGAETHLRTRWPWPKRRVISVEHLQRKSSDWITQEIGLAIGRQMEVILLLEEGVRNPGGLQGDLQYIPFRREKVEGCFDPLLQMIAALRPPPARTKGPAADTLVTPAPSESAAAACPPRPIGSELEGVAPAMRAVDRVFEAAYTGTLEELNAAIASLEQAHPEPSETAELRSRALIILGERTGVAYLEEQRRLAATFPNSYQIAIGVAYALNQLGEPASAASSYLHAASLTHSPPLKARALVGAARAYLRDNQREAARPLAAQVDRLVDLSNSSAAILWRAAELWKELGEPERFHALAELALELDPAHSDDRFTLAYEYGQADARALSLVHYRAAVQTDDSNAGAWNNFGVAASALNLPITAHRAFERARELKTPLAAGHLAHALIDIGRLEEADALCEQTRQQLGADERISSAQARILSGPREETTRLEELTKEVQPIRKFNQSWARAYFLPAQARARLKLDVTLPDGPLSVICMVTHDALSGTATLVKTSKIHGALGGLLTLASALESNVTHELTVKGFIRGAAGKLELEQRPPASSAGPLWQSLLDMSGYTFLFWLGPSGAVTLGQLPLHQREAIFVGTVVDIPMITGS